MIKRFVIINVLFICLFVTNPIKAQKVESVTQNKFQFPEKEWNVGLAYFGEMVLRPGFSLSADYPIINWQNVKDKKKGKKFRNTAIHLGGRYWNYYQAESHIGNGLDVELFFRSSNAFDYKKSIGVFDFGISAGLGLNQLLGSEYKSTDKGFERTSNSHLFFSYGMFLSIGGNLNNLTKIPLHWYIKPKIVFELPYAPVQQIHPSLEIGVNFPLSYFTKNNKNKK